MSSNLTNSNIDNDMFLGIMNKRYIKTIHGIVHGIGSMVALLLGNVVFVNRVLLGNQPANNSTTESIFHACNLLATITTAFFFWDKVQSWQLSTTSMEAKGLTPRILQRFNQGRGIVTMLLFSLFPLTCRYMSQAILESKMFSTVIALIMIWGSVSVFNLVKDYGKLLWLIYGMTPMALGISIICCSRGSIASVQEDYSMILDRFQKEASFVISCVQMGFMMYYLYSRNLVTRNTVQKICKTYHVSLSMVFLLRIERDLWLQFTKESYTKTAAGVLPWPMMIQPMILTLALNAKLLPLLLKKLWAMGLATVMTIPQKGLMITSSMKQVQSPQCQQKKQSKRRSLVWAAKQRRRISVSDSLG